MQAFNPPLGRYKLEGNNFRFVPLFLEMKLEFPTTHLKSEDNLKSGFIPFHPSPKNSIHG